MTSPNINKPSQVTNSKYENVHAKGSSFGQGLNEKRVREILGQEVQSPFRKFIDGLNQRFSAFAYDVASAIRGEGASYSEITTAFNERLGPIDTAITQAGERHTELAERVEEGIQDQVKILEEAEEIQKEVGSFLWDAQVRLYDLETYKSASQQQIDSLGSTAQSSIDEARAASRALEEYKKQQAEIVEGLVSVAQLNQVKADAAVAAQESISEELKNTSSELSKQISAIVSNDSAVKQAKNAASKLRDMEGDIETLQTEAILANSVVGSTNQKAIDILNGAWRMQDTINKKQDEWNAASETATKANTAASKANTEAIKALALAKAEIGTSLLPYLPLTDADVKAGEVEVYKKQITEAVPTIITAPDSRLNGQPFKEAWACNSGNRTWASKTEVWVDVVPGQKYVATWWDKADNAGSHFYITFTTPANQPFPFARGPLRVGYIEGTPGTEWAENRVEVEIAEGVTRVRLLRIAWNATSVKTAQYIAGFTFAADLPTQAEIDEAQNKAIEANTRSINLLNRPDLGGSLVGHIEPSPKELGDPKRKVDWNSPAWLKACPLTGTDAALGKYGYTTGGKQWTYPPKVYRPVMKGVNYRLTFKTKGVGVITIGGDTNGKGGVKSARLAGTDKDGKRTYRDFATYSGRFVVRALNVGSSSSWTSHEVELAFQEDVSEFAFSDIVWHDSGTSGNQYLADLECVPDIPTQAQIDTAQNKAIEALNDSSQLSKDFEKKQVTINSTVDEQMWAHQDMLELLDIRSPKTFSFHITDPNKLSQGREYDKIMGSYSNGGIAWETSWFYVFAKANSVNGYVYITFKGDFTGMFDIEINWDSGVLDNWTRSVEGNGTRTYSFKGGARHIKMRSIQVTVFPRSLKRKATVYRSRSHSDSNGLIRQATWDFVRFKNAVTANRTVYSRDAAGEKKTHYAGDVIQARRIFYSDLLGDTEFTEVDDPSTTYSIPNSIHPSSWSVEMVSAA